MTGGYSVVRCRIRRPGTGGVLAAVAGSGRWSPIGPGVAAVGCMADSDRAERCYAWCLRLRELLDADGAEGDRAGVLLQADEPGVGVGLGWQAAVGVLVGEGCGLVAVEAHCVGVALHLDLQVVPLPGLQRRAAPVVLLAGGLAEVDVVDRPGAVLVEAVGACRLVDLDLEAGVDRHKGRVG